MSLEVGEIYNEINCSSDSLHNTLVASWTKLKKHYIESNKKDEIKQVNEEKK